MFINKNFELDSERVKTSNLLGNGAFGLVYKGVYYDPADAKIVAIKTSKNHDEEKNCKKLLLEASILQNLHHDHILTTYGVCTTPTTMLVMEYAEFGELGEYLKINQTLLNSQTLMLYMYQISTALVYLEFKKYIHRDIAARNILVVNTRCVKLADYGLARYLENDIYIGKYYKMPIKWMSPESIQYFMFSIASDVWMFGICMWEIMMYGVTPHRGISTAETIEKIKQGELLKIPDEYPTKLKQLVTMCWNYKPTHRPNPRQIEAELRYIYTNPHDLGLLYQNAPKKPPRIKDLGISTQGINWVSSNFYKPKQNESYKYTSSQEIYQALTPNQNIKCCSPVDDGVEVDKLNEIIEKQLKDSEEDAKWLEECEKQFVFT